MLKYREECVSELEVPEDLVEQYKKWTYPEDDKTKCYINCVMKKMDLFDDEKGWHVEYLVQQLGGEKFRSDIEKCEDSKTDTDSLCSWTYRGFQCFKENNLSFIKKSVE
jgi:hypothetical protein